MDGTDVLVAVISSTLLSLPLSSHLAIKNWRQNKNPKKIKIT
jgi:hypothetical protein